MAALNANRSQRPALPPLLLSGCSFWLGAFLASNFLSDFKIVALAVCCTGFVALLGGFAFLYLRHRKGIQLLFIAFLFLGAVLSLVSLSSLDSQREAWIQQSGGTFQFRILDDAQEGDYGSTATALCWPAGSNPNFPGVSVKVKLYLESESLNFGDEFQAKGRFIWPSDSSRLSYDRKGIALGCKLSKIELMDSSRLGYLSDIRQGFASKVTQMGESWDLDSDSLSVLKALVVGDRQSLFSGNFYQDVKVAGLAHMVAVSGAHLVIVMGLVGQAVRGLRLPKKLALIAQLSFLLLYLVMVGFPVSCLRAAVMSALAMFSFASHRRSYALSSLGVAAIVLIALDPSCANSLSFALSALSTLGIVLFTPLFVDWIPVAKKRLRSVLFEPFAMTIAALLMTFPLSIYAFSQFSVVSPISNIIAVPLVTAACSLGVVGFVCTCIPLLGQVLLFGAYAICLAFVWAVRGLSSLPFAAVPVSVPLPVLLVLSFGLAATLWLCWPRRFPAKTFGAMVFAFIFVWGVGAFRYVNETSVAMLDVGQGDAILFRSCGTTMLVDTGNQSKKLLAALSRQNIAKLDAIVITHPDDDHCGSLAGLRGVVGCSTVFVASGILSLGSDNSNDLVSDAEGLVGMSNIKELCVGDYIEIGSLRLKVVSPGKLEDEGGNQDSVCLVMQSDLNNDGLVEWKGLFAGDAEKEKLTSLKRDGAFSDVDILKVSHHGSKNALNQELIDALRPKISLISVGEGNRYGHPNQVTLDYLNSAEAMVFRTDEQGDVVCRLRQDGIEVSCMK